ncbi:hypothetical protein TcCL_NonESM04723 [Trypanosoma cruzi]|nr:hypothetical protein TcCL_NonESM04723 [Trypanosoma cruzi]
MKPYAVASLHFLNLVWKKLEPHPSQAGDILAAWRRRTLILRNRLCSALIFGLRPVSAAGRPALLSFFASLTCQFNLILLLLLAALLCLLVTGKWIGLSCRVNLAWPSVTPRSAQSLAPTAC